MKKFISLGLTLSLCSTLFIGTTFAEETAPVNLNNIISDAQVVVTYNGQEDNPFKTIVHSVAAEFIANPDSDLDTDDLRALSLFDELFINNTISYVQGISNIEYTNSNNEPERLVRYLAIDAESSEFESIITMMEEFEHLDTTTLDINAYGAYAMFSPHNREDFAIANIDGAILMANTLNELQAVLSELHSRHAETSNLFEQLQNDSFLSVVLNNGFNEAEIEGLDLLNIGNTGYAFSVSQTATDTFKMVSFSEGDEASFTENDFSYDMFNFTPELYKHLPTDEIGFYLEMNNLSSLGEKILDMSGLEEEMSEYEIEDLNTFRAHPFYQLLDANVALNVEFTDDILPNITFMSDNNDTETAKAANEKINEVIRDAFRYSDTYAPEETEETELSEEDFNTALNTSLGLESDTTSTRFALNLLSELPEDEQTLFPELEFFELTYGVYDDFYLISNYQHIADDLDINTTLDNHTAFTEALAPALESDSVLAYSYFDPTSLGSYLEMINERMENAYNLDHPALENNTENSNEEQNDEVVETTEPETDQVCEDDDCQNDEESETCDTEECDEVPAELVELAADEETETPIGYQANPFLLSTIDILKNSSPWYSYTITSNRNAVETSVISLPITRLSDFLVASIPMYENSTQSRYYEQYQFEDVDFENDWFADDLEQAAAEGFIDGGDDYMFHASDAATRGAYVEMIVRHYNLQYLEAPLASTIFDDVEEGSEYDQILGIAYQEGIINGDGNANTIRPNDTLNRAEAVQMLRNYSSVLYGVDPSDTTFDDVAADAWYSAAVGAAVARDITTGTTPTTFDPEATLNRAEAVVFINRISNHEFRLF